MRSLLEMLVKENGNNECNGNKNKFFEEGQ
jgi:hypothetical protein